MNGQDVYYINIYTLKRYGTSEYRRDVVKVFSWFKNLELFNLIIIIVACKLVSFLPVNLAQVQNFNLTYTAIHYANIVN